MAISQCLGFGVRLIAFDVKYKAEKPDWSSVFVFSVF